MSDLARELRALADLHWRAGNIIEASHCHAHALVLEAHDSSGWIDWPDADAIDDCDLVYGTPIDDASILTDLDLDNDCSNAGGHLWLDHGRNDVRCVHCDRPALPVKASREARR